MHKHSPEFLRQRNSSYLKLKEKYVGKESALAQRVKVEAENIKIQRQRMMELKKIKPLKDL